MALNLDWITNFLRRETDTDKVERLKQEADQLETKAAYAESIAELQKRITVVKSRIAKTRPTGTSSGILDFVFRHKVLVGLAVIIVAVYFVTKSC